MGGGGGGSGGGERVCGGGGGGCMERKEQEQTKRLKQDSLTPHLHTLFSGSLISLIVYVEVKHHV